MQRKSNDEKFNLWVESLKSTYGKNAFFSKEWLAKEWNKLNRANQAGPTQKVLHAVASTKKQNSKTTTLDETRVNALDKIRADIGDCKRCKLCKTRTNIVFGEGNSKAKLMFVGEGPGENEDLEGRPFVGRAGQLLDKIIEAMGLKREDVYIANVVKCRPPENRRPDSDEVQACEGFLTSQIAAIKPEVVVALGATSLECLLKSDHKITQVRGTFMDYQGTKLLPTYHPAYLLRNPPAKKDVWEDMKKVMNHLGLKAKGSI